MRILAVLNQDGGTLKTTDLGIFTEEIKQSFVHAGHQIEINISKGAAIVGDLEKAVSRPDIECVLAGGGDGTVSAAAHQCWKHKKVLAVLPAGTMNLFARTLKIPLDISEALPALANGVVRKADLASLNGRSFLHQVSLGIQPKVITERKTIDYNSRAGKIMASMKALLNTLSTPPSFEVELTIDNNAAERKRLSMIAISNNPHSEGHMPYPDTIDAGKMGVYTSPKTDFADNLRMIKDLFVGNWSQSPDLSVTTAGTVTLNFVNHKSSDRIAIDGELVKLEKTMEVKSHPKALKVLMPE